MILDGTPRMNLATFVTTYMEKECEELMMDAARKNYIGEVRGEEGEGGKGGREEEDEGSIAKYDLNAINGNILTVIGSPTNTD